MPRLPWNKVGAQSAMTKPTRAVAWIGEGALVAVAAQLVADPADLDDRVGGVDGEPADADRPDQAADVDPDHDRRLRHHDDRRLRRGRRQAAACARPSGGAAAPRSAAHWSAVAGRRSGRVAVGSVDGSTGGGIAVVGASVAASVGAIDRHLRASGRVRLRRRGRIGRIARIALGRRRSPGSTGPSALEPSRPSGSSLPVVRASARPPTTAAATTAAAAPSTRGLDAAPDTVPPEPPVDVRRPAPAAPHPGRAREPQQAALVGPGDAPEDDGEQPRGELLVDPVDGDEGGGAVGAAVEVVGDLLLGARAEVAADVLAHPALGPAALAGRRRSEVLVEVGALQTLAGAVGE